METLFADQAIVALVLTPRDLGLYVTALAFSSPARLIGYGVGVAAMPEVARASSEDQRAAARRFVALGVLILVPLTALLLILMGKLVPALFGGEYADAIGPARLLLLGALAFAIRRVVGDCLRGLGKPGLTSVVEFGSWPLLLGGAAVGTRAGLTGVAYGLLVAQVAALAALLVAWWLTGRSWQGGPLSREGAAL